MNEQRPPTKERDETLRSPPERLAEFVLYTRGLGVILLEMSQEGQGEKAAAAATEEKGASLAEPDPPAVAVEDPEKPLLPASTDRLPPKQQLQEKPVAAQADSKEKSLDTTNSSIGLHPETKRIEDTATAKPGLSSMQDKAEESLGTAAATAKHDSSLSTSTLNDAQNKSPEKPTAASADDTTPPMPQTPGTPHSTSAPMDIDETTPRESSEPMNVDSSTGNPPAIDMKTGGSNVEASVEPVPAAEAQPGQSEPVVPSSSPTVAKPPTAMRKPKPRTPDLTLGEVFELHPALKRRQRKRPIKKAIKVSLSKTAVVRSVEPLPPPTPSGPDRPRTFTTADRLLNLVEDDWRVDLYDEVTDPLSFFEETHEEQDPAYLVYMQKKKEEALKKEIAALSSRDKAGQKEIGELIDRLSKEKRESTDKSHQIYREKIGDEERKEYMLLQKTFQERSSSETIKIQKSHRYLQAKHQEEANRALHNHRSRAMSDSDSQVIWQKTMMQLQAKHARQMQDFKKKSEEMKNKTKDEYEDEKQKIIRKYAKKKAEVDARRDKYISTQSDQFAQLKQRYLRRHLHKVVAEREGLKEKISQLKRIDDSKSQAQVSHRGLKSPGEKTEHQPPPPVRSVPEWAETPNNENAKSIRRQKHRKNVLAQAQRHVSIEIHNEGIWTVFMRKTDEHAKSETVEKEFIPWGQRAFMTLECIVCGEIPCYYTKLNLSETPASHGGQLRCSITDLRTGQDVALAQRAEAYKLQEDVQLERLEMSSKELARIALDAEKAFKKVELEETQALNTLEKAVEYAEKCRLDLKKFTEKFSSFLGQGKSSRKTIFVAHAPRLSKLPSHYWGRRQPSSNSE
jgi:hypothetical protein